MPVVTRQVRTDHNAAMNPRALRFLLWTTILVSVSVAVAVAQDGLYAPQVPGDAALVRVVNLRADGAPSRIDIGAVRFPPLEPGEITPYRSVPAGVYMVGGRAAGITFSPQQGSFVTVVVTPDGSLRLVTDEAHRDPARAQLVFYNFGTGVASLVSRDPAAAIFSEVPAGEVRTRAVNAISVDLAVDSGDRERYRGALELERGESYSVFVTPEDVFVRTASVSTE